MRRNLRSRLSKLRQTGEIITGGELADNLISKNDRDLLFDLPGRGNTEETPFGPCYMRETCYPLDYKHGNTLLSGVLSCSGKDLTLPTRSYGLKNFKPQQLLFLDTETTGLAGGTGTWAFLIGIGWLDDSFFMLRQYFLRQPAEEKAVLDHFTATAKNYPCLVSFNGKLFDLPLIQTRQTLAGLELTAPPLHLDLLQFARLLWKKRLPSRSLRALENALLGIKRIDDIPGSQIPAVYFDFLRRRQTEQLKKVFHHNILDILSMVTLLDRISNLAAGRLVEHPAEALVMGRLCLQSGRTEEGINYLYDAENSDMQPFAEEAALELSLYYKRQKKWSEAESIWLKTVKNKSSNLCAYVELAKYYEHQCGNYQSALKMTEKAMELVTAKPNNPVSRDLSPSALKHRLERLKRRMAVSP